MSDRSSSNYHKTGTTDEKSARRFPPSRSRLLLFPLALVSIVLAIALGVGLGVGLKHKHANSTSSTVPASTSSTNSSTTPALPLLQQDASSFFLTSNSEMLSQPATTRMYNFVLEERIGSPDGVEKNMLVVNGQSLSYP